MPTRERVQQLVDAVIGGDHASAIAQFYAEHASMQENAEPPRRGLATLVEGERKFMAMMASITSHSPDTVVIDGDRVAIHWIFDFVHKDGRTRRVDEVALQEWEGDKIVRERFFYDAASTAWKPAT